MLTSSVVAARPSSPLSRRNERSESEQSHRGKGEFFNTIHPLRTFSSRTGHTRLGPNTLDSAGRPHDAAYRARYPRHLHCDPRRRSAVDYGGGRGSRITGTSMTETQR